LTLDLKDDPKLIAEYRRYHEKIWPEITRSIKDSGIEALEIYLFGARMFMIMEVNEHFSFEAKGRVGLGMKPPTYLRQGDVVALGIDGLGTSRQEVTAWKQRN